MARLLKNLCLLISTFVSLPVAAAEEPSIFLFMVDGARPDYIEHLVSQGRLPNIKQYFYDEGVVFDNSYTSLSLTVPSWSSILTGKDIDRTALKGNDIFDRETKQIVNYLDWRQDIIDGDNRKHGRAYRQLKSLGHKTIIDFFDRGNTIDREGLIRDNYGSLSEVFMTFFPLNDAFPTSIFGTIWDNYLNFDIASETDVHNAAIRFLHEDKDFNSLDRNNAKLVIEAIQDKSSRKKKLMGVYFSGADHYAHKEHGKGIQSLEEIDTDIGEVMRTLLRSRYRNSVIVLVSDHGSQGGKEFATNNLHHPFRGQDYALTVTNLSALLTGWFRRPGYAEYGFNVESTYAAEAKFSLRNWSEFQLHRGQCTNVRYVDFKEEHTCRDYADEQPELVEAGVTTTQTIAIPYKHSGSRDWRTPNNWYTLTNYGVSRKNGQIIYRNLIKDLEEFQHTNVKAYAHKTRLKIDKHPMDWLAIGIQANDFNKSTISNQLRLRTNNQVLLIHKNNFRQALIFMESSGNKKTYKYLPIRNFTQTEDGVVSFDLSQDSDPFGYISSPYVPNLELEWFNGFHSEREWTDKFQNTSYPNTVAAVYKVFTFSNEGLAKENSARFDILLNPNYGHIFTVDDDELEANHGMFQRESVRNTFMIRGPSFKRGFRAKGAVMATDVLPTLLKAMGRDSGRNAVNLDQFDGEPVNEAFQTN